MKRASVIEGEEGKSKRERERERERERWHIVSYCPSHRATRAVFSTVGGSMTARPMTRTDDSFRMGVSFEKRLTVKAKVYDFF